MNCAIGSGALAFATFVPVDRYELTTATSDRIGEREQSSEVRRRVVGVEQLRPERRTDARELGVERRAGRKIRARRDRDRQHARRLAAARERNEAERILRQRDRSLRDARGEARDWPCRRRSLARCRG